MAKVLCTVVFENTPSNVIPERNRPQSKKEAPSYTPAHVKYFTCDKSNVPDLQKRFPTATVYTQEAKVNTAPTPVTPVTPQ